MSTGKIFVPKEEREHGNEDNFVSSQEKMDLNDASDSYSSFYHEDSITSFDSDRWSNRGLSSKVSITIDDTEDFLSLGEEGQEKSANWYKARCLKKMFGNYVLPGLLGINSFRQIDKLHYKHPISRELMANSMFYCSRLRYFLRNDLLPEIKALASDIYFPTGQIEADGLSAISGEIWAATYLLLSIHKRIREADFHNIRSAYTSLAWDSARNYRATLKFHRQMESFREKILPLWHDIEEIPGLGLKNQFSEIDYPRSNSSTRGKKQKKAESLSPNNSPLSTIRIDEDYVLEHTLSLQIFTEKKSKSAHLEEVFAQLDYGKQIEVIKAILSKPIDVLHSGPLTFQFLGPILTSQKLDSSDTAAIAASKNNSYLSGAVLTGMNEKELTCTKALKILSATLKLLYDEVSLTPSMRIDIGEHVRGLADELHDFFGYADWVANKFSEFHSMLRLCYNFASMSFDMELPSFDVVVKEETVSENLFELGKQSSSEAFHMAKSVATANLEDDQLEYKVVSLSKLMMEASASFVLAQNKQVSTIDDDFDWQDFYKTQYHTVLQRLPLRVGVHLLQFNLNKESFAASRPKMIAVASKVSCEYENEAVGFAGSFPRNKVNK